jgi:hypothetical protein
MDFFAVAALARRGPIACDRSPVPPDEAPRQHSIIFALRPPPVLQTAKD